MAFQSDDFSAFDHAVLPVLGGHGHGFEDEHVIRSFNYVLNVVHTGFEQTISYPHFFRESDHSFLTNEEMIVVLGQYLRAECAESDHQRDGCGNEFDLVFHDFFVFLFVEIGFLPCFKKSKRYFCSRDFTFAHYCAVAVNDVFPLPASPS